MKPLAGYRRVSDVGDRDERLRSDALQAERILRHARAQSPPLDVVMLDAELDQSGNRAHRPILDAALRGIADGRYGGIIVAQLDRLSRLSLQDALRIIDHIEKDLGGRVVSVGDGFDASTPAGEASRNLILTMGHMQWRIYADGFAHAKRDAVERGVWPPPKVPLGYRCTRIVDGGDGVLKADPATRRIVFRAFERRAAGAPWSEIADILGFSVSGARAVIRNRAYLGEVRVRDWVNPAAHEQIVPLDLWQAAQRFQPRPPRGAKKAPALLAGIIRCAGCGRAMTFDLGTGYRCHARNSNGRCQSPAIIAASRVEPYVERIALDFLRDLRYAASVDEELSEALAELRGLEAEFAAFQQKTSALDGDFVPGLRDRQAKMERVKARIVAARDRWQSDLPSGDLDSLWPKLRADERGHVLRGSLGVVWVRKGRGDVASRVRVIAHGYEPPNLSRPGSGAIRPVEPVDWPEGDLPGELRVAAAEHV